jgi:hypothetical protein
MKRLDLNLARRPFTNDTLLMTLLGILAAAAMGLSIWNTTQFAATGSQVGDLTERRQALQEERRLAEREQRRLSQAVDRARSELLASRASFASRIIRAHAFSWTRLFNELEQVMPIGVRLVNVRPRVEDGLWIRVDGVARNAESFWELQESLQSWPVFGNVYPDALQPATTSTHLAAGELLFSLEMEYFPDARLKLGLPPEPAPEVAEVEATDGAVEPAADTAGESQTAAVEEAPVPAEGTGGAAGAGQPQAAQAQDAQERDPVLKPRRPRRGRGARRGQVAGIERPAPLPGGAPGMETPEIPKGSQLEFPAESQLPIVGITPDGRVVDEDGNEVSIEELINQPGHIRPGPPPEPGAAEGLPPGAGESGKATTPAEEDDEKNSGDDRQGRRP